jgi:hypothetical protein
MAAATSNACIAYDFVKPFLHAQFVAKWSELQEYCRPRHAVVEAELS